MWSAATVESPRPRTIRPLFALSGSDPYLSIGRPYVTLRVTSITERGFVFTLTDPHAKEVTSPTITAEAVARALEGRQTIIRNGGFALELTPVKDAILIKGGPLAGLQLEGFFRSQDVEAAVKSAIERTSP